MIKKIYVTVGWKNSNIPMANKVRLDVFLDEETEIQAAKKLRKDFAANPQFHGYSDDTKPFKPSDLYWGIFENTEDSAPSVCSNNWHDGIIVNYIYNISGRV